MGSCIHNQLHYIKIKLYETSIQKLKKVMFFRTNGHAIAFCMKHRLCFKKVTFIPMNDLPE